MHPVLLYLPDFIPYLGGKPIHTYGVLVALGFFCGMLWVKRESLKVGLNQDQMIDLFFYIVLSGLLGSRLMYFLVSVPDFWSDPLQFFRLWEGGLVFYGGLIAAVIVIVIYTRKYKLNFLKVADVFSPGVAIGHVFGRLGCLGAGCCFGREAPLGAWYGIIFPHTDYTIAPFGVPLFPTQLMESFGELMIFLFLIWFRRRKKFEGELFLLYIILYPILRSVIEMFRGDKIRGFVIEDVLSTSQFISLVWVAVAVTVWLGVLRKKKTVA